MKVCKCGYCMIDGGYMYTCTKCGRSENAKGFRAWVIRLLISTYKVNRDRKEEMIKFKNGSKIIPITSNDVIRSSHSKLITLGRPRLTDRIKDWFLKFK